MKDRIAGHEATLIITDDVVDLRHKKDSDYIEKRLNDIKIIQSKNTTDLYTKIGGTNGIKH